MAELELEAAPSAALEAAPRFMNVRQVAEYLQLNEKKIYALIADGGIPATKVTGKWMFPRELIDRWLLESSHGGVLADRLGLAGAEDPLLYRIMLGLGRRVGTRAIVSYSATGTQPGLALLARGRAEICALHWGPASESAQRHAALLAQHRSHAEWILLRAFTREQGLMVRPEHRSELAELLCNEQLRWVLRQEGSGTQRFLQEVLARYRLHGGELEARAAAIALSEREAAARVRMNEVDVAPGSRASASEFGLAFVSAGWEAFDLALPRGVYFRRLFQQLLDSLRSEEAFLLAERLGGYDLGELGRVVWTAG